MKVVSLILISCLFTSTIFSQGSLDNILIQVETNNKALKSNQKLQEANQAEFKTGLTPYDPVLEYDYMWGSPAGAGNQRDFSLTQRFDFPSVYKRKNRLSDYQIIQSDLQKQVFRQDILLEAKLLILEITYLNKKDAELKRRLTNIQNLVENYQKKLDNGKVIILDVNKAKLQLLNIKNETSLNDNARQILLTKLSELNGNIELTVKDTTYPLNPVIPDFETLDSTIEANDPLIKVYEQEKTILKQQIAVQKAMNLPKIETGYHSQGILGQSYKGIHGGISIPLWENKNRLRASELNFDYAVSNAETIRLEHRIENKQYFEQLNIRREMIREYREILSSLNNTELLNKALQLGQITIIQYFYDESFYFTAYDSYLQAEWEYHQAVAKLYKYLL